MSRLLARCHVMEWRAVGHNCAHCPKSSVSKGNLTQGTDLTWGPSRCGTFFQGPYVLSLFSCKDFVTISCSTLNFVHLLTMLSHFPDLIWENTCVCALQPFAQWVLSAAAIRTIHRTIHITNTQNGRPYTRNSVVNNEHNRQCTITCIVDSTTYGQFCSEARRPGGRITTTTPQHCRSSSVASKSSIGELVVALTLNTYHTLLTKMIMVIMALCCATNRK